MGGCYMRPPLLCVFFASVSFAIAPRLLSCCACFALRLRLARLIPANIGRPMGAGRHTPALNGRPRHNATNPPDHLWH